MSATEILLGVVLALAGAAYYFLHRRLNYWQRRGIPADPPHWLYGNLNDVPKKIGISEAFTKVYKRYVGTGQPFCGFYLPQQPAVLALSPDFIKRVLIKDFNNFIDRGMYSNEKHDPLTGHLFRLDGAKWRYLRHKLSPTFTPAQMKFMFPTVLAVADQFVEKINIDLAKSDIIEIKEIVARFTTDVIGSCAFGIECNSLKNPAAIFRQMGKRVFNEPRHSGFVMQLISSHRKLASLLHLRIISDDVTHFFMNVVREAVGYREKNNVQRKDFLNILMDLNRNAHKLNGENGETNGETDAKGLTFEQMAAQAFVFFVAGFESSSATLSFLLYELALNVEIQQRLRQEILQKLAEHDNELTFELINSLPYMKQVIAEILRKYPVAAKLQRLAQHEYVVPEQPNYVIEKGTLVIIPVMAIHHNPEIYPEPEKFNPERFAAEEMLKRDSINWLPFGDGPRNCIGMRFADMQMRVALIYLLRNFEIFTCSSTKIPLQLKRNSRFTASQDPILLNIRKI